MPHTAAYRPKKYFSRFKEPLAPMPNLIQAQLDSFKWFIESGISQALKEFSPIQDYAKKKFELSFGSFEVSLPKYSEEYAKVNKLSYEGQLKARVVLKNKSLDSTKEQEIFLSEVPLMTSHGTFIINGIERIISPQLARSFGIFFTLNELRGPKPIWCKDNPCPWRLD